ncbi:hypothetical protein AV530_016770 [Patagioenas fasciata monilis]|uniref:Uncharacterized protein n=1 Tax=Patagioenas fasciata monilis TaxID=372326 RepID=A0A1V4J431_PATFA|nr:hypothetical protein AV530_016770 [Patagioenas fasciata monilis]
MRPSGLAVPDPDGPSVNHCLPIPCSLSHQAAVPIAVNQPTEPASQKGVECTNTDLTENYGHCGGGNIFIWASGNSGLASGCSGADGYMNIQADTLPYREGWKLEALTCHSDEATCFHRTSEMEVLENSKTHSAQILLTTVVIALDLQPKVSITPESGPA